MALMSKWSLRRRTLVLALAPALLMLCVLMGYHVYARLSDSRHELEQSGVLMATQLAAAADYAVISGNLDSLEGQVQGLLKQPGVVSVRLFDMDNRVLLSRQKPDAGTPSEWHRYLATIHQQSIALDNQDLLVAGQASSPNPAVGKVEIGISGRYMLDKIQSIPLNSLFLGLLALAPILALGGLMARDLEAPLRSIIGMVGALKNRHFEARVSIAHEGELGVLAYHLNLLASMLEEHRSLQMKYTEELIESRTRADKASQAKGEFLAMMSHELRTPLNAILGSLQLLNSGSLESEQREYGQLASQAANDLRRLVDDVLDFSRLDEGRLMLQLRDFSPAALVESLRSACMPEAHGKGLEMDVQLEGQTQLWLRGDEVRISQVLRKLIDNAIKFTDKGRVGLRVRINQFNEVQAHLLCEVFDTGIGISASSLPHVFEPFMQVDRSHSRRYGGAGLGLTIASRLTRLMQGDLRVESEPLVGTCFCFEVALPISHEHAPEGLTVEAPPRKSAFDARVLVVDDNPANRKVAEAMLRAAGCTVLTANNGKEALDSLHSGEVDLVLMDCQMPVMDGYEATRLWRNQEHDRRLPIIALTANASPDNETACLEAGMDAVLGKPFRRQQLEMLLGAWLET
ncbi:signal transduction histidine kinase [Fluviicoccus keumensis]|uniref:histidine kinase n=1 Tax=Fluviicoccus keumensis TaxID=1435465 RepID=A0A4Q7ZBJ8_9GAMM|nr:response regulator [Fluviicoccus keumensis]RZU47534.1 signal transduction histidine kinase [Fluviicoccus keumensis]